MRLGGNYGGLFFLWMFWGGGVAPRVRKIHQSYYLPMTTAMAVAVYE